LCTKDSRENLKVGATRRVAPTEVREEHPFIINAWGVYDEDWGARGEVKIDETLGNE